MRDRQSGLVEETRDADPVSVARSICLDQLAHGPRSRAQLATTLHKRRVPEAAADEVLDRLTAVGLIDDAAFARAWVESRHAGRGLSARALARELRDRGVAADLVESAVSTVSSTDEATARELAGQRLRSYGQEVPLETRLRRTVAMLARRGYSPGVAYRVVRAELGSIDEERTGWVTD